MITVRNNMAKKFAEMPAKTPIPVRPMPTMGSRISMVVSGLLAAATPLFFFWVGDGTQAVIACSLICTGLVVYIGYLRGRISHHKAALYEQLQDNDQDFLPLRHAVDSLPLLIAYIDASETVRFSNQFYHSAFQFLTDEIVGKTVQSIVSRAEYRRMREKIRAALAGLPSTFEQQIELNGDLRHVHVQYLPDFDSDQEVSGFYMLARDISSQKLTEDLLANSEKRLRLLADNIPALLSYTDRHERFVFGSNKYLTDFGVTSDQIVGMTEKEVLGEDAYLQTAPYIKDALELAMPWQFERRINTGASIRHERVSIIPDTTAGEHKRIGGYFTLVEDITALKETEMKLTKLAKFDGLTGLANRVLILESIQAAFARSRRVERKMAVFFLDLDKFKHINDTKGHKCGDEVLVEFARRISSCIRETDMAGRLAGDEFVILLENLACVEDATCVAEKILQVMMAPFKFAGESFHVTTSIGIAEGRPDDNDPEKLLTRADHALYESKAAGRGCYHVNH